MNTVSTHVLNTTLGMPASGLPIILEIQKNKNTWEVISKSVTNSDGRVPGLLPSGSELSPGIYRLTFDTATYFKAIDVQTFYPYVTVVFETKAEGQKHYHVPLLLSPYGYSTYRGS